MSDMSLVIKKRLLKMRSEGATIEKQRLFIADAVACNRRFASGIRKMAADIDTNLVVITGHRQSLVNKTTCCSASLRDSLNAKKGTMEFWYQAVNLTANLRDELLSLEEIETLKNIKSESMLSGQVCSVLGVSKDNLRHLDAENILPHRFKKMMVIKGRRVAVRCWLLPDVHAFLLALRATQ